MKRSFILLLTLVMVLSLLMSASAADTIPKSSTLLFTPHVLIPSIGLGIEYQYRPAAWGIGFDLNVGYSPPSNYVGGSAHVIVKWHQPFNQNWGCFLGLGLGAAIDRYLGVGFSPYASFGIEIRSNDFVGTIEGGYAPFIGYEIMHAPIVKIGLGFVI